MRKEFLWLGIGLMSFAFFAPQTSARQLQQNPWGGGQQGLSDSALAEQLLGKSVQNQQGQDLGNVMALAARNGEIVYILIAKNGNLEELTPIPFIAISLDARADAVVLSMSDDELAQAPTISIDELQRLDDPEFESQVHGYFGQEEDSEQMEEHEWGLPPKEKPGEEMLPMKETGEGAIQIKQGPLP